MINLPTPVISLPRPALLALAAIAALCAALGLPGAANAADNLMPTRTLFSSERFTQTSMRAPITRGQLPHNLLALRGESEGFQLAMRNDSGETLRLNARLVETGTNFNQQLASGRIQVDFLRVGFVEVPQASSGGGGRAGALADPLPPLRPLAGSAGLLNISPGQWGGLLVLAHVRTDATTGRYTGQIELYSGATIYARQPFSMDVRHAYRRGSRSATVLKQPGSVGAFRTVLGIEGESYWLGHKAMRNGPSAGYANHPDRMAQLEGLMIFMADRGVMPRNFPFANPSAGGDYSDCRFDSPPAGGSVPAVSFQTQLSRYLAKTRRVDPSTRAFGSRVIPSTTAGCNGDRDSDDYTALRDPRRTPAIKQDDYLDRRAPTFWTSIYAEWARNGWLARRANTYTFNPFDEPSDSTAAQRYAMNTQVPLANRHLHERMRNRAKVALTSWPRDSRVTRQCRIINGSRSCVRIYRDTYSNMKMWDSTRTDNVDVWIAPISRMFGRIANAKRVRHGYNANVEYKKRLALVRGRGAETWGYNFYTGTRLMPQLTIDAPGTDARLQYWMLARDGHTGLYVSNSMLGWAGSVRYHAGTRLRQKGNPYEQATYFRHRNYGYAAGWGTFIYPPYDPSLGLTSEDDRNTAHGRPVSSLRMEGLRDGQEDANLTQMYRARFGAAQLQRRMNAVISPRYRPLPTTLRLGNVVVPVYSNTNMAQRMETQRRIMIRALSVVPA